jgi:hypothetical protein
MIGLIFDFVILILMGGISLYNLVLAERSYKLNQKDDAIYLMLNAIFFAILYGVNILT